MARISSFRETGERYFLLRVLAGICYGVGIGLMTLSALLLIVGAGSFFGQLAGPSNGFYGYAAGAAAIWSFGSFAAGIQTVAMGSFFRLAINIEENTRATAQALERLRTGLDLKAEPDPRSMFLS